MPTHVTTSTGSSMTGAMQFTTGTMEVSYPAKFKLQASNGVYVYVYPMLVGGVYTLAVSTTPPT